VLTVTSGNVTTLKGGTTTNTRPVATASLPIELKVEAFPTLSVKPAKVPERATPANVVTCFEATFIFRRTLFFESKTIISSLEGRTVMDAKLVNNATSPTPSTYPDFPGFPAITFCAPVEEPLPL
jgi:hypothetical protein